jgi:formamidopyrimidine-DNA glycosylase
MPELPEVQTVVSELNRKLRGKKIVRVDVRAAKLVSIGPHTVSNIRTLAPRTVIQFQTLLRGQKILSVKRRAKLLIFDLSGPLSLLVHLKMTGQFIYEDKKLLRKTKGYYRILNRATAPKILHPTAHTHVIFYFDDDSRLYYNDVRKFGYLKLVRDDALSQSKELAAFGPEPLSKNFRYEVLQAQLRKYPKRKIKQALMDSSL